MIPDAEGGEHPYPKILLAMECLKFIAILILLFALLQLAYVGETLISEKYDSEVVEVMRAAFYLGGLLGGTAMVTLTLARSMMGVCVDLCVCGLKYLKDRITGENQKYQRSARIEGVAKDK